MKLSFFGISRQSSFADTSFSDSLVRSGIIIIVFCSFESLVVDLVAISFMMDLFSIVFISDFVSVDFMIDFVLVDFLIEFVSTLFASDFLSFISEFSRFLQTLRMLSSC